MSSSESRHPGVIGALASAGAVVAIVLGAVAEPATGSVLSMIGVVLVLVRAVLGTSAREHARRTAAVRRVARNAAAPARAPAPAPARAPAPALARGSVAPALRLAVNGPLGAR